MLPILGGMMGGLGGAGGAAGALTQITGALKSIPNPASAAQNAISGVTGGFSNMANVIGQFTKVFDPGQFERFQIAVNNVVGAVGEILRPVMEAIIPIIQKFGSIVVEAGQMMKPVIDVIVRGFGQFGQAMTVAWRQMQPFVQLIADHAVKALTMFFDIFAKLAKTFQPFQELLQKITFTILKLVSSTILTVMEVVFTVVEKILSVVMAITRFIDQIIYKLFGVRLIQDQYDPLGDKSRGKAVTPATYTTGENILRDLNLKAFGSSGESESFTPAENKMITELDSIAKIGKSIYETVGKFVNPIEVIAKIAQTFGSGGGGAGGIAPFLPPGISGIAGLLGGLSDLIGGGKGSGIGGGASANRADIEQWTPR